MHTPQCGGIRQSFTVLSFRTSVQPFFCVVRYTLIDLQLYQQSFGASFPSHSNRNYTLLDRLVAVQSIQSFKMVQHTFITLLLPILALGAPQGGRGGNWGSKPSVAVSSQAAEYSAAAYTSQESQPTSAVASSAPASTPSSSPSTGASGVTLHNNCGYDVTYDVLDPCGSGNSGTIAAGSAWTGALTDCSSGNSALKLYGNGSNKPMQFEYGIVNGNVWYDMSFIDCISGTDDFSQCVGTGWSMGAIGSCPTYSCSGGSECCIQGYCDPTATAAPEQPNAGCGAFQGYSLSDLSITMGICN